MVSFLFFSLPLTFTNIAFQMFRAGFNSDSRISVFYC